VVRVDGVFDRGAAARLSQILEDVEPGATLCVDLSHARECCDSALAILGDAVEHNPSVRVDILGLDERRRERLRAPAAGGAR
jgi:hypothetical protein